MKKLTTAFAALTLLSICNAEASPLQWITGDGGNGHYYELVLAPLTWTQAEADAESRTFNGVNGHLASITSAEENNFVTTNFAPLAVAAGGGPFPSWLVWIGGYQPLGSPEPGGGWSWASGEAWTYSNWSSVEPNNSILDYHNYMPENWLGLYISPTSASPGLVGQWADTADTEQHFYVVEYVVSPIPEPQTYAMLLAGLGLLGFTARRKKQNLV
jgi:hypothetical protein